MRSRILALCAGVMLGCAPALRAHDIHTTMTSITRDGDGLRIRIRSFADDFSASVARHAGRPAPADSSAPAIDVFRYVSTHFSVRDVQGRAVPLEPCGVERAAEVYWLCFRVSPAHRAAIHTIRNGLLMERYADQVNIVRLALPGEQRTLLFTRTTAAMRVHG